MLHPYVVGQSGTLRPESVLVTRLPARTRRTVQPARNFAYLWSMPSDYPAGSIEVTGRPHLTGPCSGIA
jgi:hypothetical protein